jgi:predicted RNase H-like HicB family nuclease
MCWSDADAAYIAEAPDLAGCAADGRTRGEALSNLRLVISEWIETAAALGRRIPQPGD